jgi:hypothetical protein
MQQAAEGLKVTKAAPPMYVGGPPRESVHHRAMLREPIDRGSHSHRLLGSMASARRPMLRSNCGNRGNEGGLTPRRLPPRPVRPRTGTCAHRNRSPTSSPEFRHNRNRRRGGMNRTQLLPSHLPRGRKAAAEARGRDLTVLRKNAAHDLKHGEPPWFEPNGRCGTRASLQKFDSARVCDARRTGRIRSLRYTVTN